MTTTPIRQSNTTTGSRLRLFFVAHAKQFLLLRICFVGTMCDDIIGWFHVAKQKPRDGIAGLVRMSVATFDF
jgi:hypothetical protein